MNNGFLVPANAKKGTLIFGIFRPFDLTLFGTALVISLCLIAFFSSAGTLATIIFCLPAAICGLLVVPIPNYHNVLCAIQSILRFYNNKRSFVWKGWCFYERFTKEQNNSK